MRKISRPLVYILPLIPLIYLESVGVLDGASFSWQMTAARLLFTAGVLLTAQLLRTPRVSGVPYVRLWPALSVFGAGSAALLAYAFDEATWAAWLALAAWYAFLLGLEGLFAEGQPAFTRWVVRILLAVAAGVGPVAAAQVESHFADEEFFVALQALGLVVFWLLLLLPHRLLLPRLQPPAHGARVRLNRRWVGLVMSLLSVLTAGLTIRAYQHSFYSESAPGYPGISAASPFLCGQITNDLPTVDGVQVFQRLLTQVAANPEKGSPEYGMLALGTGDEHWAAAFREALLAEAGASLFSGPAHSVKYIQYDAALRAYYLPRVRAAFPALFSQSDLATLQQWFARINRRALTAEPTDWMYALAFAKLPGGPYENQENGAGLLALLVPGHLAAPELARADEDYLLSNPRGWVARFRNTDDAYPYQSVWINNAYFQSLYAGRASENNLRLSFEWLSLQALPGGAPLVYNYPEASSSVGADYLGASLLNEPHYVWLTDQALRYAAAHGDSVNAQPGAEQASKLTGQAPTTGSCLMYGDSGLPNQVGPLAPDKIVLRDGWAEDSTYVLLNLRFSGWHRYKATNTISLVYQGGALAGEVADGQAFNWLPVGRSAFRDKRVPRENLNGLLVERSGMSTVLYRLTGAGGPWAQDPPYYAEVTAFRTGAQFDYARTRLVNWRGWQHDRQIHLFHDNGPIVILDDATGPQGAVAALTWHVHSQAPLEGERVQLRAGAQPAEMVFLSMDGPGGRLALANEPGRTDEQALTYYPPAEGQLHAASVILVGEWVGAEVKLDVPAGVLLIRQGQKQVSVPIGGQDSR